MIDITPIANKLKYMIAMHKFFISESKSFMKGTSRFFYYGYYLIAYIKFMDYCHKDYVKQMKTNTSNDFKTKQ